jgi:O-antigen/teichoic acid export membrane protein
MSIGQIIVVSIALFFLYRYLLDVIGAEQIGLWSLILATTAVSQIANLGLSGSIVKYVAKYAAREDADRIIQLVETAVTSVAVVMGLLLVVFFPLGKWLLRRVIPAEAFAVAVEILPIAFVALWIMSITSVVQSGLDGFQRIDLRAWLIIAGTGLHFALCIALAPRFKLMGLAYARLAENVVVFVGSWILFKTQVPGHSLLPGRWNKSAFFEMVHYSLSFQVISIAGILTDPISKGLMGRYSSLATVGYYEMASRFVQQVRLIVVSANQVLVPEIARLKERLPHQILPFYRLSCQFVSYLSLPLFTSIVVLAPSISEIWIGRHEGSFVTFLSLLAGAWLANILSAPAYIAYMGIGEMRWNVISQLSLAAMNLILGYLLGAAIGGVGVCLAWAISLVLGSSLVSLSFHLRNRVSVRDIISSKNRNILFSCLILVAVAAAMHHWLLDRIAIEAYSLLILLIGLPILVIPLWKNPMRLKIREWIMKDFLRI